MKTTQRPPPTEEDSTHQWITFGIIALGSLLFSLKGVFAKLAYGLGSDPLEVLTLRMAFALPIFAIVWVCTEQATDLKANRQRIKDLGQLAGLGFLGYYATSLLDFTGLQFVSAALERIILFCYPTIVLLISGAVLKQAVPRILYLASLCTWVGVGLSFFSEMQLAVNWGEVAVGTLLIFLCASLYAIFIIASGRVMRRMTSLRFTSGAMTFSSVFMLSHFSATRDIKALAQIPSPILGIGVFLAIGCTVVPSFLMSYGLKRAGAARFAIISSIGPVTTIFAGFWVLGEIPGVLQWVGFFITLASGLFVALRK